MACSLKLCTRQLLWYIYKYFCDLEYNNGSSTVLDLFFFLFIETQHLT